MSRRCDPERPWRVLQRSPGRVLAVVVSRHATYFAAADYRRRRNCSLLADDLRAGRRPDPADYCWVEHQHDSPIPEQ